MRALKVWLAALLLLLSGCVAAPVVPPQDILGSIQRIRVIAMEAPPLEVPARLATPGPLFIGPGPGPLMVSGILILIQAPQAAKEASGPAGQESARRSQILSRESEWLPSAQLAEDAKRQLALAGRPVEHSPMIQPLPGITDRSYTLFGENWMAPIRSWYGAEKSEYGYAAHQVAHGETVLEVGISNYSVYLEDRFLLQVLCRLVDPAEGRVLGRARAASSQPMQMGVAFADNAKVFKETFLDMGGKLVHECLKGVGLIAGP